MIIVEGPDGAGKSTLIKQILNEFPQLSVAPRVVSKETEALVDLRVWVDNHFLEDTKNVIFDRHRLISEPIYGPILRRQNQEPGFTDRDWMYDSLVKLYIHTKPLVIYCLPPLEVVKANLANDPDNVKVVDSIDAIYCAYVAKSSIDAITGRAFVWDYTIMTDPSDMTILASLITNHLEVTHGRTI